MKSQKVIVRDFKGEPLVRQVRKATKRKVYISSENSDRPPIGFPRENVFTYEPGMLAELEKNYKRNPSVWDKMKPWKEDRKVKSG